MRRAIVHGPTIAAIVLFITGSLYIWIDPKENKLEKIKVEKKNEKIIDRNITSFLSECRTEQNNSSSERK